MATKKTPKSSTPKPTKKPAIKTSTKKLEKKTTQKVDTPKNIDAVSKKQPETTTKIVKENKIEEKVEAEKKVMEDPYKIFNQITSVIVATVSIGVTIWVAFSVIPGVYDQTDQAVAAREERERREEEERETREREENIARENNDLDFENTEKWALEMKIKIEEEESQIIKFDLYRDWAPETVENFVRLTYRDHFDGRKFHRMVEDENFKIIQGVEPREDEDSFPIEESTATGEIVPDELWITEPEYDIAEDGQSASITNEYEFREPSVYQNFDENTGNVTYKKGLILMAKTANPDSATTQFFITLDNTILPAQYTVFGEVTEDTIEIMDYLLNELEPLRDQQQTPPDRDVIVEDLSIV